MPMSTPQPSVIVGLLSIATFACAVGTSGESTSVPVGDAGRDAPTPSSAGDPDTGSPVVLDDAGSIVDTGAKPMDAGPPKNDASVKADAGANVCAPPSTPAGCNGGCTAHVCAANGCYGGYICDTAVLKCRAPGLCP